MTRTRPSGSTSEVSSRSARALATLGRDEDARVVFGKLLATPAWHPRLLAAAWLAGRGDPRGLEVLTALAADTDPEVRIQAIGLAPARADLLLTSLVDADGRVRVAAAARLVR